MRDLPVSSLPYKASVHDNLTLDINSTTSTTKTQRRYILINRSPLKRPSAWCRHHMGQCQLMPMPVRCHLHRGSYPFVSDASSSSRQAVAAAWTCTVWSTVFQQPGPTVSKSHRAQGWDTNRQGRDSGGDQLNPVMSLNAEWTSWTSVYHTM